MTGRTEEAHALIRHILEVGGIDPVPLLRVQAPIAIHQRRFKLAREVIDALERTAAPTIATQVEVARLRASISARAGHIQEALRVLQTGIRLSPGDPTLRLQRAKLLVQMRRFSEASVDVNHLLKLRPGHPDVLALQARIKATRPGSLERRDPLTPPDTDALPPEGP